MQGEANPGRGAAAGEEARIRHLLSSSAKVMEEAYSELKLRQSGKLRPASTGYHYLDEALLGGLYPQKVLTIGARPSVGKSFITQKICEHIMDVSKNPEAGNYLLVNCEFEMVAIDLLVRKITRETKRPVRSIMTERQTEETEAKIREVVEGQKSPNIVYLMQPINVRDLDALITYVMERNREKRLVIFKLDHIALVRREGGEPKKAIDGALAVINDAKLKYKNIAFIIISQLNREIEGRKMPKEHEPRMSDFYQSDELAQLSTVMVALNSPRRLGYDKYMSFPASWYQSLDKFKTTNKTSFQTEGLVFHHLLKVRDTRLEELRETIHPEIIPGNEWRYEEGRTRVVNPERPTAKQGETGPKPPSLVEDDEDDLYG